MQGDESTAQVTENVKLSTPETITVNDGAANATKDFITTINFDQDDVNKEFWFLIEENPPVDEENAPVDIGENNISGNILYDATRQHWIKVTVEIDANDKLIVKKNDTEVTNDPDASFTNTVLTNVTVTKAWSSSAGTQAPDNVSIVLGLFKGDDQNTPVSSITLNGTVDPETSGEEPETTAYPSGNSETAYEDAAWHATWTNLPVAEADGTRSLTW